MARPAISPGRRRAALAATLALLLAAAGGAAAARADGPAGDGHRGEVHRFAILGHSFANGGQAKLEQALKDSGDKALAFMVVTGIKGKDEGCGDKLYLQRRDLLNGAKRPVIVAPAGSDWTECRNSAGRSNAIERLNRLRELYYGEPASLGARPLPLARLSMSPRFRSYAENAHWEVGKVLYATINLPANNNHFLPAAGRNSEYEDRLVANRFWLNRLFALARRDKLEALVLFSEGDLKALAQPTGLRALLRRAPTAQDGFAQPRRQVQTLAQMFPGKVLLVDSEALPKGKKPAIEWRDNVGHLSMGAGAPLEVRVTPGADAPGGAALFALEPAKD
jgi:hypothetical protein